MWGLNPAVVWNLQIIQIGEGDWTSYSVSVGVKQQVPRLRMSGAVAPAPPFASSSHIHAEFYSLLLVYKIVFRSHNLIKHNDK
jgi:hypothetical protein